MNRVVEILMNRDGLTKRDAKKRLDSVRNMLDECSYDPDISEDIIYNELGIELDYLADILYE